MEFPDAEEHARVILEAVEGDNQTALENVYVLRAFGFSEEYCCRIEALLTPTGVSARCRFDGSDFRAWLVELADDCAATETPEEFFKRL